MQDMQSRLVSIVASIALAVATVSLSGSAGKHGVHAGDGAAMVSARADNSRQNALLRRAATGKPVLTAQDQPNDHQDRLLAARVRRVICQDDTLSIYAHNVKIIAANGSLTLEGPVQSDAEREELALDAATVVRTGAILDKLTVA
jgi:osmotically-inducible protein OsmY